MDPVASYFSRELAPCAIRVDSDFSWGVSRRNFAAEGVEMRREEDKGRSRGGEGERSFVQSRSLACEAAIRRFFRLLQGTSQRMRGDE